MFLETQTRIIIINKKKNSYSKHYIVPVCLNECEVCVDTNYVNSSKGPSCLKLQYLGGCLTIPLHL